MKILLLLCVSAFAALAQNNINGQWQWTTVTPSGTCSRQQARILMPTGVLYTCANGTWASQGGGGGGTGTVTSVGLAGTANQITVTGATPITTSGAWTLSFPTNMTLPGNTTGTFIGNLTGNVTGTVTNGVTAAATLTSTAFMTGGGSKTTQTPSATATLDASGNAVFNSISLGGATNPCDGTAGCVFFGQGTAPSGQGTTGIEEIAPTSVTSYRRVKPGAAATGFYLGTNSSNVVTETQVASTGSGNVVLDTSPTIVTPTIASFTNATHNHTNAAGGGQLSLTAAVTGILPVANGGTNCSSATITCFNNITGFTAAGTTGTTSTNLVFSTSPTLVTPNLGTPASGVMTNVTGVTLSGHASQTADTVVMNATGGSASPTAVAMPTCTTGANLYNTSTHAWSCVATGGSASLDRTVMGPVWEEFWTSAAGNGTIGALGWTPNCGGTVASPDASEDGHNGIYTVPTTAAANGQCNINLTGTAGSDPLYDLGGTTNWEYQFIFKTPAAITETKLRIGFALGSSFDQSAQANALYARYENSTGCTANNTDATWIYEGRLSGSSTTGTGPAIAAATWYTVKIRSTSSGTALFSIASGTGSFSSEVPIASNVPTAKVTPYFQAVTCNSTAKTLTVDAWGYYNTGVLR